ncbi:hypothetical protein ES703_74924 [subsurface metagenome]
MTSYKMTWFWYIMVTLCVLLTGSTASGTNGAIEGYVILTDGGDSGYAFVIAIKEGTAYGHYTARFDPPYEGYYKIPQLPPGTYELHVIKEGYECGLESEVPVYSGEITTAYVSLAPEGIITGQVKHSDQITPIADVVVIADDGSGFTRIAKTNASGNYTIDKLPEGTYTVKGAKLAYTLSTSQNVDVTSGQTTSGINLIGVNGTISGTVTKSDGITPIEGAFLAAENSSGVTKAHDMTDSLGHYELTGLTTGNYTVKAWRQEGPIAEVSSVSVTDGETTNRNLAAPGGSISGTVKNSSQTAIEGATLTAIKDSKMYIAASDASGDYTIEFLAAGTYEVTVDPGDNDCVASKINNIIVVTNQETSNQDFTLGQDGKITGTITNTSQEPIEGAVVGAIEPDDAENDPTVAFILAITDASGNYTIAHLRTGTYTIFVDADNYVSDSETNVSVTAGQITSGNNFSLGTSGGTISGTVYESDGQTPIEKALVMGRSQGKSSGHTFSDSSGNYSLTLLQAGTYEVAAYADGYDIETLDNIVVTGTQENSDNDFTLDAQ